MSAESLPSSSQRPVRRLRLEEKALIAKLAKGLPMESAILNTIEDAVVEELSDGGMGSLKFVDLSSSDKRFAKQIREATFADEDGVPVSITINLDQNNTLFELDIWKADNSPLKRFPRPDDISIR
jgi:hypothetical protein